jgi:hypothetical protein
MLGHKKTAGDLFRLVILVIKVARPVKFGADGKIRHSKKERRRPQFVIGKARQRANSQTIDQNPRAGEIRQKGVDASFDIN